MRAPLWDQHCCLPVDPAASVDPLARSLRGGAGFASVNVGYAPHDAAASLAVLRSFRRQIEADDRFRLAGTVPEIVSAQADERLAVAFDLEDSRPLDGDLTMVRRYHDLGVRTLAPTYNFRNAAGSGCLDARDEGLTRYGRDLVAEMNRVGMVADGSHCGARTGLDMCAISTRPVVYSHSCMRAVWDHPRNITDEQAKACADTGGVVGITGVGIFLGANDIGVDRVVEHIDHAVELLGPEHVGFSSDYPFDAGDLNQEMADNPQLFSDSYTRWGPIQFFPPEEFPLVRRALTARGYPDEAVNAILGGNFMRVAAESWQPLDSPA